MVLKNLFTGKQWRNRHREQTSGHWERGGEGEMYGESNMENYITICKIDSQQEFAVWLRELKQGLCITLEGLDGEGDGREVQKGGDKCIPMADSLDPWKKSYGQPRQYIKKQRHYFANKGLSSQTCGFSSSHVWI